MNLTLVKLLIIFILLDCALADLFPEGEVVQKSEDKNHRNDGEHPVSNECLRCICKAVTGCYENIGCSKHGTCGPLRMTKAYWIGAGKPTKDKQLDYSEQAFENCAKDYNCACQAIQNTMSNSARDCNYDGRIDCYDFAAFHEFGRDDCHKKLPKYYLEALKNCTLTEN